MSLAHILAAPGIVQLHTLAAVITLGLALPQMMRRKGGRTHRLLGWGFVLAMTATAVSSFWITGLRHGQFSWIHLLSVVTLVNLAISVGARRLGHIALHRGTMIGALAGLVGAGAFTLLPGRVLHRALFG